MKNDTYADDAKVFPRVYGHAMMSLLRRLRLFRYPFLMRNLVLRAQEVTHLIVRDYLRQNVDEFNGRYNLDFLQYLVAKDVDYVFVDEAVGRYIEKLLSPSK